ncbi:interferon-induced protein with tetratricopeptide repeats 1-like [Myxocyprinus asiaticus]|uniref:interferon-induced protein with tetratricopeptide repeats 1-like n=1 Tax=Myxocyprinus asiaticus TaxID=70543 RepID=UPI002222CB11|nr:interferon-induced protein with tetratricopeptide repeats 1-like [Myxocyprinus asiaticus]
MNSPLKCHLEKLECHFTWDLGCYKHKLQELWDNFQDMDQQTCTWQVHYNNLLGYIQHALGSNEEALMYLHKAASVIQEQGTEEAGARLQVNKANLAWVHFLLGNTAESKAYLEEVEKLQQMHPAPSGCTLHPEVSGEKGWTLVKFDLSKKQQSIDFFRMALKAEPERKEWHKGLARAMSKPLLMSEFTTDEVLEQLKRAKELDPDSLFLQSLYWQKRSEVQAENYDKEVQSLLQKTIDTGKMEGLSVILKYFKNISMDKAIQEGERVREKFPTSTKVLRNVANLYKWKVYSMNEDSREKQALVEKSIELFEEVVRHYPHNLKVKLALASMYQNKNNIERANEIYKELLSEEDDLPPHRRQRLYYSYACYLFHSRQSKDSILFYMKAAEIPDNRGCRLKCIKVLQKTLKRGRDPHCEDIFCLLQRIQQEKI